LKLAWDSQPLPLTPGTQIDGLHAGLHADLPTTGNVTTPNVGHTFSIEFALNGSGTLAFAPLAVQTSVRLKSPWADPSFTGAFLPTEREITPAGFNALWKIPYYGRDYSQQWTCLSDQASLNADKIEPSCFGVDLVTPVDSYRSVERATKHGALFITLLFTAFFLFEVLASLRLHALHYLLVGAALCLFYLGLLSLSEFIPFGTAALFTVLAVVMFATRKVDWSNQSRPA
jgi:inner membrane protein